MCTLLLARDVFPGVPVAVAANRDEFLARASSGPRVYEGPPRVLRPRDEVAGGTWLGLNEHRLFVGVTNRAGSVMDPSRRSRGLLVAEALQARDAASLHRELASLRAADFNAFHLLYADRQGAYVTWSDGASLSQFALGSGVHVVTERSLGADDRGRTEALLATFERQVAGRQPTAELLRSLMTLHGPADEILAGTCIHADAVGYGTRSTFVWVDGERPQASWSEGHPCETQATDLSPLLASLFAPVTPAS
jgi:uncharacterized protein with NRDE domain